MTVAAEEQRDPMTAVQSDHSRGKETLALVSVAIGVGQGLVPDAFPHQFQDLDGRVVVMQHLPLGRLPDQLIEHGGEAPSNRLHDVPLGRGRQRDAQIPLQAFEAVEWQLF